MIVPTNFEDYLQIESFFTSEVSRVPFGGATCSGTDLTCASDFLARLDPSANIFNDLNQFSLSNPEVSKALSLYKKSYLLSSKKDYHFWSDIVDSFNRGEISMALTYSNYVRYSDNHAELTSNTGYTFIPGNNPLIGGGVIGLSKKTQHRDLCIKFLEVLYSDEISSLITFLGGTMPNKHIYHDSSVLALFPWLELVPNILKKSKGRRHIQTPNLLTTLDVEKMIGSSIRRELKKISDY